MMTHGEAVEATITKRAAKGMPLRPMQEQAVRNAVNDSPVTVVMVGGPRGSGKSFTALPWLLERGMWDTGRLHLWAAPTFVQLKESMAQLLPLLLVESVFGMRPPWQGEWRSGGVVVPQVDSYRGILTLRSGLHVIAHGALDVRQLTSIEFGSMFLDDSDQIKTDSLKALTYRLRLPPGTAYAVETRG